MNDKINNVVENTEQYTNYLNNIEEQIQSVIKFLEENKIKSNPVTAPFYTNNSKTLYDNLKKNINNKCYDIPEDESTFNIDESTFIKPENKKIIKYIY